VMVASLTLITSVWVSSWLIRSNVGDTSPTTTARVARTAPALWYVTVCIQCTFDNQHAVALNSGYRLPVVEWVGISGSL
jgi:hypothetical protein